MASTSAASRARRKGLSVRLMRLCFVDTNILHTLANVTLPTQALNFSTPASAHSLVIAALLERIRAVSKRPLVDALEVPLSSLDFLSVFSMALARVCDSLSGEKSGTKDGRDDARLHDGNRTDEIDKNLEARIEQELMND